MSYSKLAPVTRSANSTQFYIFNLFANFITPRHQPIWTNKILYLLDLLGVSQTAARSTLSRMKQQGWVKTKKVGRRSQYALTRPGLAILAEGDQRIFEQPLTEWDGVWHLVVYSLPEKKRKSRNHLRKKLLWFGFGKLAPGTWISPHDRTAELGPVLADLEIQTYTTLFAGPCLGPMSNEALVDRCWDVTALQQRYEAFIQRYQPDYDTFRGEIEEGVANIEPEACFSRCFWLAFDFQRFPREDPNLPTTLLPKNWSGYHARHLFNEYRHLLRQGMAGFMEQMLNITN